MPPERLRCCTRSIPAAVIMAESVAWSGNIYFGLWYTLAFTAVAIVVALIWLPETKGRDMDTIGT